MNFAVPSRVCNACSNLAEVGLLRSIRVGKINSIVGQYSSAVVENCRLEYDVAGIGATVGAKEASNRYAEARFTNRD